MSFKAINNSVWQAIKLAYKLRQTGQSQFFLCFRNINHRIIDFFKEIFILLSKKKQLKLNIFLTLS